MGYWSSASVAELLHSEQARAPIVNRPYFHFIFDIYSIPDMK